MQLSGTVLGFICVLALFVCSLILAFLDKREKSKGHADRARLLSRTALGLFIAAFVGGVVMTLVAGVGPRSDQGPMKGPGQAPMAGIGTVDEQELRALQEKVASNPKDVASRERLGHLYLQLQDYENVFQMSHEAIQQDPHSVESRVHMGMVLFAMQETHGAMKQFEQALLMKHDDPEALLFKGLVQFQGQNDLNGAKATWEHYLKTAAPDDPGQTKARTLLDMVNSRLESR